MKKRSLAPATPSAPKRTKTSPSSSSSSSTPTSTKKSSSNDNIKENGLNNNNTNNKNNSSSSQQQQTKQQQQQQQTKMINAYYFDRKLHNEDGDDSDNKTQIQVISTPLTTTTTTANQLSPPKTAHQILEENDDDDNDDNDNKSDKGDSLSKASHFMDWLLYPSMDHTRFMNDFFEKRVLYIDRFSQFPDYYSGVFTSEKHIPEMVNSGQLEYTYDVDVALYRNGVRYTLNPSFPKTVDWCLLQDFFQRQNCSIRFLRPHQHVNLLCSMLCQFEEFFQMGSGCNAYWTPAQGNQGFAPHYDDVDVFILQLEGTKQWSLYQSREPSELLANTSSPNFKQEDVEDCFVTTVELKPGDLLYCPRGTIHQAKTITAQDKVEDSVSQARKKDSLHITISTAQQMSWKQYLEMALPMAIEQATSQSEEAAIALNQSLPVRYGNYMGMIHERLDEEDDDEEDEDNNGNGQKRTTMIGPLNREEAMEKRDQFRAHLSHIMDLVSEHFPVDDAADLMYTKFLHDRLPPQMALSSKLRRENHLDEAELNEPNPLADSVKLSTRIRFISNSVARLVVKDEDRCTLVHSLANTRVYHEIERPEELEFEIEYAPAIHHLLTAYPRFTTVKDLPELEPEEQLVLAQTLVDQRLAFCVNPAPTPAVTKTATATTQIKKKNMKALAQKKQQLMMKRSEFD